MSKLIVCIFFGKYGPNLLMIGVKRWIIKVKHPSLDICKKICEDDSCN